MMATPSAQVRQRASPDVPMPDASHNRMMHTVLFVFYVLYVIIIASSSVGMKEK
jgi:hypothetical protein